MKPASPSDTGIVRTEDGQIMGVFLAADYTAEHEQGIKDMLASFGIDDTKMGLAGRTATRPPHLWDRKKASGTFGLQKGDRFVKGCKLNASLLVVNAEMGPPAQQLKYPLQPYTECDITGAFDSRSFAVAGFSDDGHSAVEILAEGIETSDLVVMLGGGFGRLFGGCGLAIGRASMIPQSVAEKMQAEDEDAARLEKAAAATGLVQKAATAQNYPGHRTWRKPYFALVPAWHRPDSPIITSHPVVFFLNPVAQDLCRSGWFSVEDLEAWLDGAGPVMK